jgi:toxin YoeB
LYRLQWHKRALSEYEEWKKVNKDVVARIDELLEDILATPFNGMGKPEMLKFALAGYWSRRITQEHRLVYKVAGNSIIIFRCRGHYKL